MIWNEKSGGKDYLTKEETRKTLEIFYGEMGVKRFN